MGEKKPEKYIYKKENKEKFPIWFPSHPPVYKIWRPTVFRVERNRKQAGPTLGGAVILIYRDKRNKGSGAVWVDRSR